MNCVVVIGFFVFLPLTCYVLIKFIIAFYIMSVKAFISYLYHCLGEAFVIAEVLLLCF